MQIDLAFFPKENIELPDWNVGEVRCLPRHKENAVWVIDNLVRASKAEYTLVWDMALGKPKIDLVRHLANGKIDVWHAGLKFGLQNYPEVIDFVRPTWLYNINADNSIISSSFRVGFQCFLFRNALWKKGGKADASYESWDMTGLDLGYRWLKSGALMRYHPDFVNRPPERTPQISLKDEFRFARKYFSSKWVRWILFRLFSMYGVAAVIAWWRTRRTKQEILEEDFNTRPITLEGSQIGVSVLVPTLDRYPYLFNELVQLQKQTLKPLEVLVTDQTEDADHSSGFLKDFSDISIRYFPQRDRGQCIAWNKLLEEAGGEAVLFLGDDADAIRPDFIQRLVSTMQHYDADMVAAHVEELIRADNTFNYVRHTDTFPICLVKRKLLLTTGYMDMVYNRDIRADGDLAIRCHKEGALMIYDRSITVFHHHAPAGGLRAHRARVLTRTRSKKLVRGVLLPTVSEIYLRHKYFSQRQTKEDQMIRLISMFFMEGGVVKRLLRILYVVIVSPSLILEFRKRKKRALSFLQ